MCRSCSRDPPPAPPTWRVARGGRPRVTLCVGAATWRESKAGGGSVSERGHRGGSGALGLLLTERLAGSVLLCPGPVEGSGSCPWPRGRAWTGQ